MDERVQGEVTWGRVKNNSKAVMYYRKWSKNEWMGPVNILRVTSSSSGL